MDKIMSISSEEIETRLKAVRSRIRRVQAMRAWMVVATMEMVASPKWNRSSFAFSLAVSP